MSTFQEPGIPVGCEDRLRGFSAAGRGRDRALKVAQCTVCGVDGNGDREVEDGGGGGAAVKHSHGGAPRLCRAVGGQDLRLKLQQLAHEAEVGEMMLLLCFTNSKASSSLTRLVLMR